MQKIRRYKKTKKYAILMDAFPLYNEAFERILNEMFKINQLIKVSNSKEFHFKNYSDLDHQIAIIDIGNIRNADFSFLINLRLAYPKLKIIVTSACEESAYKKNCFLFGASGFILKTASRNEIVLLLSAIFHKGNSRHKVFDESASGKGDISVKYLKKEGLSQRELETLSLVLLGKLNSEIAISMGVSIPTIKAHMTSIFKKSGVCSRTSIVSKCLCLRCKVVV